MERDSHPKAQQKAQILIVRTVKMDRETLVLFVVLLVIVSMLFYLLFGSLL